MVEVSTDIRIAVPFVSLPGNPILSLCVFVCACMSACVCVKKNGGGLFYYVYVCVQT